MTRLRDTFACPFFRNPLKEVASCCGFGRFFGMSPLGAEHA
jgi:hypothetical protein